MNQYKNEHGILTINGYVVIPNKEFWGQYKEYYSTTVSVDYNFHSNTKTYCRNHSQDPDQYPCIVESEYDGYDNYHIWQHSFIYKYELQEKLEAIRFVEKEIKKIQNNNGPV